jgi:hypothetical protein
MAGTTNSPLSSQIRFLARITGRWLVCIIAFFYLTGTTKLTAQSSPATNPVGSIENESNVTSSITPQQRAMIIKASHALRDEATQARAEYLAAYAPLTNPPVLNMSQVTNKGDLQVRITKVKEYLAAANRFHDYSEHLFEHYDEQIRANIPDEFIQKTLREGFQDIYGNISHQAKLAGQLENQRTEEYLKGLKFLEDNWDKWRPKTPYGSSPVFSEPELTRQYNNILREINKLRAKLIEVNNQTMTYIEQGPR